MVFAFPMFIKSLPVLFFDNTIKIYIFGILKYKINKANKKLS